METPPETLGNCKGRLFILMVVAEVVVAEVVDLRLLLSLSLLLLSLLSSLLLWWSWWWLATIPTCTSRLHKGPALSLSLLLVLRLWFHSQSTDKVLLRTTPNNLDHFRNHIA